MLFFMETMLTRMQQEDKLIVSYMTNDSFISEEQLNSLKPGGEIVLAHDVKLKMETVKDAEQNEWLGVFTSSDEVNKGSTGNVQMNQSVLSIFHIALKWSRINGIVINPFGKYVRMTKEIIRLLLDGYEYYGKESTKGENK